MSLNTKYLGRKNYYYEAIDSTQKEVWRLYDKNYESGVLVYASLQKDAIGTHGRVWYTEQKNNIAFSFLLKPNCKVEKIDGVTIEIANIITNIFKDKYNISLEIKHPNDIVYDGKKIGGILVQTKLEKDVVKAIVVGIGINTSQEEFNYEIKDIATSIKKEFGVDVDVKEFISEFCCRFEEKIKDWND